MYKLKTLKYRDRSTIPVSLIILLILSLIFTTPAFADTQDDKTTNLERSTESLTDLVDPFANAINGLLAKSFTEKSQIITAIETTQHAKAIDALQAMLKGRLFYRKADKRVVIGKRTENGYTIHDAISGDKLGTVEKRKLKKISVNNRLRKQLRGTIARLSLSSDQAPVRLAAVSEMLHNITEGSATQLRQAMQIESDKDVLVVMQTGIALFEINSDDKNTRLDAIKILSESLEPEAKNALLARQQAGQDGSPIEADTIVREAIDSALKNIERQLEFYGFLKTIFFGLSLGSVLLLAAIGLAITFGVMGVINMAHGELIMIGAYTTYVVQQLMPNHIEWSLFVAIPMAFIVAGLTGIAIERGVIRFLYGRPLETLLATFGISLVLQQLVRSIFSPLNRSVETPSWMSGVMEINGALALTYNRFYIIIFSLLVFFALLTILKKTSLGLQVRAVSQNRAMAKAMGVRSERVDALTFGLGSGIAGVAGVALSQLTNVGPNLGQAFIIDSFMVVVFGGVGNLWGTLVGAMSLGVVNKFIEPWSGAVLAKILVLIFIILFIQKRPRGLFPQKGRAAEH